ncbi:V-type ATPase subunit [Carnobacteriaceae bacterium zg-ZUI252]|nr:V-type ATPase subunit [Carnobacteriaceae bacterium zg-ZUI252]MBS4770215.1 V-type ATPase subunit [Carnobacteriaceae bacterium zg-ZUI240]
MFDKNYASANTIIRIKEREFLTSDQWEQLLRTNDLEQALNTLKNTVYSHLTVDFEKGLQESQIETYQNLSELIDDEQVENVFSLIYVYHNLKVLIKESVMNTSLSHLLVPIGAYSIEQLRHLVQTQEATALPEVMVSQVKSVLDNYAHYENVQSIDVMMDEAYFSHVLHTADQLQDEKLIHLVRLWIDIFNVTTILRLSKGRLSRSQLTFIMSAGGHLDPYELIQFAMNGQIDDIVLMLSRVVDFSKSSKTLQQGDVTASVVERLKDSVTHDYLQDAKYEAFGFLPVLAYVFYKEMEIKNLRLILTGKDNQMDTTLLRERMKPTYVV